MERIEIISFKAERHTIHYKIRETAGLNILKHEEVDLSIKYQNDGNFHFDLRDVPDSILLVPISLYMLPIIYFYNIELVIPMMDKTLYGQLPAIYDAYSKIYGPFKEEWRGKLTVGKFVEDAPVKNIKFDKIVFFSGGVDACHAGIDNPDEKSLLVSIPDIEREANPDGPLRKEKFSLIKNFAKVINSKWLVISNNLNTSLFNDREIWRFLSIERNLHSEAYGYDGWHGIIYLANMCSVAPIAYITGAKKLIMGSTFEQIEDQLLYNYDGACPELSDSIGFNNIRFTEQNGLRIRRSQKVKNVIDWSKRKGVRTKMWVCFSDHAYQCGYCVKCVRTQLNILCAGENPKEWGFDNFDEQKLTSFIRSYQYLENNPCWIWDNIDSIKDDFSYPYCDALLHWLKSVGYKKYYSRSVRRAKLERLKKILQINRYPHYISIIAKRILKKL